LTKAALPHFREQKAEHFIQVTSIAGRIGPIGRAPYAAAKWGVEGFSETLAKEVAPFGVNVTIVEPGGFRTDFAGASTTLQEGRPEYDETVGKSARFQRELMASSLVIPSGRRLLFCGSPRKRIRLFGSLLGVRRTTPSKRMTWRRSSRGKSGRNSAFQQITRSEVPRTPPKEVSDR
jgi:NAD(P)-dependent dehydrogenase (short-subunit alcohol dehydrogenase family)